MGQTRDAFHEALVGTASNLPDPDPGEVAAYLRRQLAAVTSTLPTTDSPQRTLDALSSMAEQISAVENGTVTVSGTTYAAWQEIGDIVTTRGPSRPTAAPPAPVTTPTPAAPTPTRRARRRYSGGGLRPYHKRFTRFNTRTLAATDELFNARPSTLPDTEKLAVFNQWVEKASNVYGMDQPRIEWVPSDTFDTAYHADTHSIEMGQLSVVSLLHGFRRALSHTGHGPDMVDPDPVIDARAWSLSLYEQVRPRALRQLVHEGRIPYLPESELD